MTKFKTGKGRRFQISIANRKEDMLTLRMITTGILLIRKAFEILSKQKNFYGFLMDFS